MALADAGGRDANQPRAALQGRDVLRAGVAHAGAQTADQLVHHRGDAALVGDAPLDPFRHQLLAAARRLEIEFVLEVTVARAAAHRTDRSHAAVLLEAPPLIQNDFAGTLVGPREEIPDHRGARANGDRFCDVARETDAAIRDDRDVARRCRA